MILEVIRLAGQIGGAYLCKQHIQYCKKIQQMGNDDI
jgi:hypothetical protein